MVYIILLLIIIYSVYKFDINNNKHNSEYVYWGICASFILLAGLRYKIGGDTIGYMANWNLYPDIWNFNWINDINAAKTAEVEFERYGYGWFLYVMILKGICNDFVILQIANAFLLNYSIFRVIKRYSPKKFLTVLIFYFNFTFLELEFEVMRESVAISIYLLFAFDKFIEKQWIKYYLATIIAYLIHPSAVFMFILPFVRNLNWSLWKYIIVFIAPSLTLAIVGRSLLGDLLNVFMSDDGITTQYVSKALDKEVGINYILMYIYRPLLLLLFIIAGFRKIKNEYLKNILFFSLFFMNFSLLYFTASRLVNYLIIIDYIAITPIIYSFVKSFKTIYAAVILLVIYSVPTLFEFNKLPYKQSLYFPYQTILYPNPTVEQKKAHQFRLMP